MNQIPDPEHQPTPIEDVPNEVLTDPPLPTPRPNVPDAPPSPVPPFRPVPGADPAEPGPGKERPRSVPDTPYQPR